MEWKLNKNKDEYVDYSSLVFFIIIVYKVKLLLCLFLSLYSSIASNNRL